MNSYRIHIAAILLVLFLVPQANNAVHYFVTSHDFNIKGSDKTASSGKDKHDCDTSLFKIPLVITAPVTLVPVLYKPVASKSVLHYIVPIFKQQTYAYRLRGPPSYNTDTA